MDKDDRMMLRNLIRKTERKYVEDVYSANYIDDPDDMMTAAEHGFMRGFIA